MKTALIPGSFDPITLGHYDIIVRSAKLFDRVIVAIFHNSEKKDFFPIERRLELAQIAVRDLPNVEVAACTDTLLVDFAKEHGVDAIVKGVRNGTDFTYEYDLSLINRTLFPTLETVFLPAKAEHQHLSSTFLREMIRYRQPIADYLPPNLRDFVPNFEKK